MLTIIIIVVTVAVSLLCFTGTLSFDALKFNAYDIWHRKQWHRTLTYGFVHGGWGHLVFNMLTLYFFGVVVEKNFAAEFGQSGGAALYIVLYVSAIFVSSIGDLIKHKDDYSYSAVGA